MWRGFSTYRSMYMSPLPKAATASADAVEKACASAPISRTIFIPRPPPPAAALRMTGKPISRAKTSASRASLSTSGLPGSKRQARLARRGARAHLVAHQPEHLRPRAR